jgi:uncharacterized caspase-like protein
MPGLRAWIARCALLLGLAGALPGTGQAATGPRVGLVIGNGAYQHLPRLANPGNDARAMAAALERLGFEVELATDVDRAGSWAALKRLVQRSRDAEAAVFYYAGHGVQSGAASYLVPVDAALESEFDLAASAVRVTDALGQLEAGARATLVFLDACRNDPFADRPAASRALLPSSGTGGLSAGKGMLVAYATGRGDTACRSSARSFWASSNKMQHASKVLQGINASH